MVGVGAWAGWVLEKVSFSIPRALFPLMSVTHSSTKWVREKLFSPFGGSEKRQKSNWPFKKCQWYAAIHENSEHKALFNVSRWEVIAINLSNDQLKKNHR